MNELKKKILDTCNSSGLPLEAIIFVLKDIYRDAEDTLRAYENQKQEEEKNNG